MRISGGFLPIRLRLCGLLALVAVVLLGAAPQPPDSAEGWRGKAPSLLWRQAETGPTEFLVVLSEQADLSPAARKKTKLERGRFVRDTLVAHAARTQAPLRAFLQARGAEHRPYWIANLIWVRGDARLMEELARRPDVLRLDANPRVRAELPLPPAGSAEPEAMESVEWNLTRIDADLVWSLGYTGRGAVVAGQDTGYQWNHPAVVGKYRGWDGVTASHDHNWHDAIHSGGGICGHDAPAPCDDNGHGTHTLGTMVGDDGGSNRIGVAPGARWIGCRNMDQGIGTPTTYTECFQWFVAPTDRNGLNPDPSLAPDVINNSWTCPPDEGCSALTLKTVVENTVAAGIVVVASAGNAGSACASVTSPSPIYAATLTVGATDSLDLIAPFSGRGPVTVDGSGRRKPDVCAPGVSVRSSVPAGAYATLNGTSMAAPHVAGLVALLLEARPDLRGRVDDIRRLMELSAVPLTSTQDCGGLSGQAVPNNTYGYGRADALSLLTGDGDGDGTGNLSDCLPVDGGAWSVPTPARDLVVSLSSVVSWMVPDQPGATAPTYDLLRSTTASDFTGAACVAAGLSGTEAADAATPAEVFFYLVRANNGCGANLGSTSEGVPRVGPICQ